MTSAGDEDAGLDGALRLAFGKRSSAPEASPSESHASAQSGLAPGSIAGQFRVLEKVGQGGMGELFLAHDQKLDRRVALKSIRSRVRLSHEGRQRFHREAQILGRLDHSRICRIYDYVETESADFLVLEYIEGKPLSQTLSAPLPQGKATDFGIQIADALTVAHAEGVVHRDLKPSNLMVTPSGGIKVLDFGIARALAASGRGPLLPTPNGSTASGEMTQVGAVMGTLDYMSPEQARGESVTGATDVFALGLLLQEMWTGARARPRELTPLEMLRHIESEVRSPAEGLKGEMRQLVDQMCAPLPTMRPTAHAVGERLKWIAEKPKRRLRARVVGGAILVATLGGLKYTLDLRSAHAATVINQARADRLIRFMHEDLWNKLGDVGQLEILEDVWEESSEYFESMAAEELSDEQLVDRARAFRQIGTVRRDKLDAKPGSAERAFRSSYELAVELLAREPDNLDRRFEVGQAEFYLGELALFQREFAAAEEWLGKYHETSLALAEADPSSEDYAMELAWSEHNLGAVYDAQGRPAEALAIFAKSVSVWREFLVRHPADEDWLQELASSLSWLAKSALASGDLDQARTGYTECMEVWHQLIAADRDQRQWPMEWAVAAQQMATVERLEGKHDASESLLAKAQVILEELCAWDPVNAEWARSLALNALFQGQALMEQGRMPEAKAKMERCVEELTRLTSEGEPSPDLDFHRAICHVWLGELALRLGEQETAQQEAERALRFLQVDPTAGKEDSRGIRLHDAPLIARAELLLAACGSRDQRQDALVRAAAALAPHVITCRDPRVLWPFIVVQSLRGDKPAADKWTGVLQASGVARSTWEQRLEAASD